jgi:hypothetical protein
MICRSQSLPGRAGSKAAGMRLEAASALKEIAARLKIGLVYKTVVLQVNEVIVERW